MRPTDIPLMQTNGYNLIPVPPVDFAARFCDPLAGKVSWESMSDSWRGIDFVKLKVLDRHKCEFRPSRERLLFAFAHIFAGLFALALSAAQWIDGGRRWGDTAIGVLVGALFLAAGAINLWNARKPLVFDLESNLFCRGRPGSKQVLDNSLTIAEIHSIQLIRMNAWNSNRGMLEMNLILHGGKRVHLSKYLRAKNLQGDARKLGTFLGVPVWEYLERQ